MNAINLYEYIKYGLFLKNFEDNNPFDLIVYEKFDNSEISFGKNIKIKTLDELGYEFGVSGTLSALNKTYKNILLVIDSLSYVYLLPFLKNIGKNNITIINLGSGISGYVNKGIADLEDIGTLTNYEIEVYENFDFFTFFEALTKKENKYFRVASKELPTNIFSANEADEEGIVGGFTASVGDITSLTDFGLLGDNGTIIASGSLASDIISAGNMLTEGGKGFDIFLLSNYKFKMDDQLKRSISKTGRLIMILDAAKNIAYENYIKSMFFENGIGAKIYFLYPNIGNINTTLKEYVYNQANLDADGIYKNLINL